MSEQLWVCDHKHVCKKANYFCGPLPLSKLEKEGCIYSYKPVTCESTNTDVCAVPYNPPKEATMLEYELLKPVSIKALDEAGACESELHRFAFLLVKTFRGAVPTTIYTAPLNIFQTIEIASQCKGGIEFLLGKGFIRVKEELLPCPFCGSSAVKIEHVQTSNNLLCVKCQDCWAKSAFLDTRPEVISNWNHRV